MKQNKTLLSALVKHSKKVWIANLILALSWILMQVPSQLWLMSISQGAPAKPFNGAMMPLAFVPDWQKSDYIDRRAELDYSTVAQGDLLPLPRIEDVDDDFNSHFTYITMFMGKYMDEEREQGQGSHDGVDIRAPIGTPVFAIANGKVVKVRNDADNKYITVEHRNVKYKGKAGKYYSSYLHLSKVNVQVGEVIDKGTMIGRVGMTGFTTTPHLHLQVDNEDAPFVPYWPFDTNEANDAGLSTVEAVTAGLNHDLILKYSVDPIDFIKRATPLDGSVTTVATTTPTKTNNNSTPGLNSAPPRETVKGTTSSPKPIKPIEIKTTTYVPTQPGNGTNDITYTHKNYTAISYLKRIKAIQGAPDGKFHPDQSLTRAEMLAVLMRTFEVSAENKGNVAFSDIKSQDWWYPYIATALRNDWITDGRKKFEPNRPVTRIEFMTVLARISKEKLTSGVQKRWSDVRWSDPIQKYAKFAWENKLMDDLDGNKFNPNKPLTRAEAAEITYRYLKIKSKLK